MAREWLTTEVGDDNCVHVVPLDDLKPHAWAVDCDCEPELELIDDAFSDLVVHNAYDKRELH